MLAASFSTVADAAKKKAGGVAADPVYEWNVKNMPPQAAPGAAEPAKKTKQHRHHAKKMAKKKAKKS